jgi:hypothetical protein
MTIKAKNEPKNAKPNLYSTSAPAAHGTSLPSAEEVSKRIGDRLPPLRYTGPVVVPPHGSGI